MKVAIVGGTHGNEVCGIEVIQILKQKNQNAFLHEFQTIHGNPRAFKLKQRYVDMDLNRAFGPIAKAHGYEEQRAKELSEKIKGNFDFTIDLHTTTSNMGGTVILNSSDDLSRRAAAYLQSKFPEVKIISEEFLPNECVHLNQLTPARLIFEFGPVAHNILSARIVIKMLALIECFLSWNTQTAPELSTVEYYKQSEVIPFPKGEHWMIHPHVDGMDFEPLYPGAPLFVNHKNEIITYQGHEPAYPFFVNEASYREKDIALILASKHRGWTSQG